MSSLPTVGESGTTWAAKLNDFLGVSHGTDGTLKAGACLQIYAGAAVFPDGQVDTAATFQNLDLHGIVGSNSALCLFKVTGTGANTIIFRTDGDSGSWANWLNTNADGSFNKTYLSASGGWGYTMGLTANTGIIEWAATTKSASNTVTIYLVAYIK